MTNFKKIKKVKEKLNTPTKNATSIPKEKIHKSVGLDTFLYKKHSSNSDIEANLTKILSTLLEADVNAAEIYKNVLENIKNGEDIYYELNSLRNDHLRHIDDLTKWVPDFHTKKFETKGSIWSNYTKSLDNTISVDSFLKALLSSEKKVHLLYSNIENTNNELDKNLKQILFDNSEDEESHIKYIEQQLNKNK